ncbi:hypothetical protein MMC11_009032, partial [Xylographa trunciseda]|nr:hypothetical protein [Xylographa trunciseda]
MSDGIVWLAQMGNLGAFMSGMIAALYAVGAAVGAIWAVFTMKPLKHKKMFPSGASALAGEATIIGTAFERPQSMVQESLV